MSKRADRESSFERLLDGDVTVIPGSTRGMQRTKPRAAPVSSTRRTARRVSVLMGVSDGVCAAAAWLLLNGTASGRPLAGAIVVAVGWIAVFRSMDLYDFIHLTGAQEFRRVIAATSLSVALSGLAVAVALPPLSAMRLSLGLIAGLGLELVVRRAWRSTITRMKTNGALSLRTLIVGTGEEARRVAHGIERRFHGFQSVGFVAVRNDAYDGKDKNVRCALDALDDVIADEGVECLFVASTEVTLEDLQYVGSVARRRDLELRISANLPEILTPRITIQQIDDVMALAVKQARLTGTQAILKRSFDLVLASLGIVVLTPLLALVAIGIRLTSSGPILFRQRRVTRDGRVFTMLKFRTMVQDQAAALEDAVIDLTQAYFKLEDDPRLTRIGRVLRSTSIDELPQLWNVVIGDMSLVGPRPLPVEQIERNPELGPRHEVRSGLTGWWQINGRSDVRADEAFRMDMFYVENWSLSLDAYILLETLVALVRRRGAR